MFSSHASSITAVYPDDETASFVQSYAGGLSQPELRRVLHDGKLTEFPVPETLDNFSIRVSLDGHRKS
jgi:hypothetical protein